MCGFLGQIGPIDKDSKEDFIHAFDLLNHRGPDSSNIYQSSNMILGHKRLSIIDINERSNQPFTDGKNFLLYNGEIYNFRSLRKYLANKYKYTFNTEGDTEVLFYGLKEEGIRFIERIDGMFSFCYVDKESKVFLARDEFGQKPLFYGFKDKVFVTGSELIPLVQIFKKDFLTINIRSAKIYLKYGATIAPSTIYNEIFQVSPGESIEIDLSNKEIHKHNFHKTGDINKKVSIKDALQKRVNSCLVADTPIAFLSSGGIDSSALITTMRSIKSNQPKIAIHLKTYEDKKGMDIAKKLEANDLSLQIVDVRNKIKDEHEDIKMLIERFGEPFADTSYFYSEDLYSSIPDKYKVVIGGDGADEIFFGYRPKLYIYLSSKISLVVPAAIRSGIISILKRFGRFGLYASMTLGCRKSLEKVLMGFDSEELNNLNNEFVIAEQTNVLLRGKEILDFYDNYLMTRLSNVFMKKSDHASMKFSKELRSPYLQGDFKEFRRMITFIDNFIAKFKLKLFLLSFLNISDILRKKIGFNILSEGMQEIRKRDILFWSEKNRPLIESIFNYNSFISLVKSIKQDRYLFRIQVLTIWLEVFYEKRK